MFDIGIGEIIIVAVIGLLVFGPEKLPRAAADLARSLRHVRGLAGNARKDLADSAGLDLSDARAALSELSDLHPRRILGSFMEDLDADPPQAGSGNEDGGRRNLPPQTAPGPRTPHEVPKFDLDAT